MAYFEVACPELHQLSLFQQHESLREQSASYSGLYFWTQSGTSPQKVSETYALAGRTGCLPPRGLRCVRNILAPAFLSQIQSWPCSCNYPIFFFFAL